MSRSTGLGVVMALALVAAQIGIASVAAGGGSQQTPVPRADGPGYSAGAILVKFKRSTPSDARESALRGVSGKSAHALQHLGTVVVDVPEGTEASAVQKLSHNPNVRWAERDGSAYQVDTVPNDPYFPWTGTGVLSGGQWGHGLTQATKAWDITTGSSDVIIAVVDSGIDAAHPDLSGQVVAGTSVIGGTTVDTHGHGEYVAGAAAASGNNAMGGAGYCWRCKLMPVKITDTGTASYSAMASAITWATDHGARVINVSFAGASQSATLDSAVSYATNHGSVV